MAKKIVHILTWIVWVLMLVAFLLHGYHPILSLAVGFSAVVLTFFTRKLDYKYEVGLWL